MGALSAMAMAGLSRIFLPAALLIIPLILYFQCSLPPLRIAQPPRRFSSDKDLRLDAFLADRGAALLHSWSDEELFHRATTAASNATNRLRPTDDSSPRFRGFWKRFDRGRGGAGGAAPPGSISNNKVAFLFLTTGSIPLEPLWRRFLRGHERHYNVYVHADPFNLQIFNRSSLFWGRIIPSFKTERGAPSLAMAMKRLLANALVDDPNNRFFATVSDSCIPLHGFHRLHKRLMASPDKSFMEILTQSYLLPSRYDARGGKESMLPEVPFEQFAIGSQWFVITRSAAELLVGEKRMWSRFSVPCLPEFAVGSCYTEEHYFPTVMNAAVPGGSHGFTLTYVRWPENSDGHPATFGASDIDLGFLRKLQEEEDGRFMFARKFHPDCLEPLLRHADVILKH